MKMGAGQDSRQGVGGGGGGWWAAAGEEEGGLGSGRDTVSDGSPAAAGVDPEPNFPAPQHGLLSCTAAAVAVLRTTAHPATAETDTRWVRALCPSHRGPAQQQCSSSCSTQLRCIPESVSTASAHTWGSSSHSTSDTRVKSLAASASKTVRTTASSRCCPNTARIVLSRAWVLPPCSLAIWVVAI